MHTLRLVFVGLFGLLLAAAATSADLVTLSGKKATGKLVAVEAQTVAFEEAGGAVLKVPVKEVAAVDLRNKITPPGKDVKFDEIELTDGSVVRVVQVAVKGKKVELGLWTGGEASAAPTVELPMGAVFWLLRDAHEPQNREDWKKLLAARGKRDLFVVRQAQGLNPLPGTVIEGNEAGDRLTFQREDGQPVSLPLSRATGGLVFNQPPRDVVPPTLCKVYDVLGNVWYATAVEVQGSGLRVRTVSGATVSYPTLTGLAKLDFSQGNVTYLSDLEAVATYPPPEKDGPLGEQYPFAVVYQKDRPIGGTEIILSGRKFAKGISVPPDTSLTYKLDGAYREFKAVVGILDGVKPDNAALKLRIEADGRVIFAETISRKDPPKDLNLNVKDVKELRISVEREALFSGNQVNLAEARVQK